MNDVTTTNGLKITPTTDDSDSEYILHTEEYSLTIHFDYAVHVANGDQETEIGLYNNGFFVGSVAIEMINESLEIIADVLLDEDEFTKLKRDIQ